MRDAVSAQRGVGDSSLSDRPLHQLVEIVIVARDTVAAALQHPFQVIPAPQSVQDDDLVPERPFGIYDRDVLDFQVEARRILFQIGAD